MFEVLETIGHRSKPSGSEGGDFDPVGSQSSANARCHQRSLESIDVTSTNFLEHILRGPTSSYEVGPFKFDDIEVPSRF